MKYKIKRSGKTQKTVEFHISKEIIGEELNKIYREISRAASLPGFRKGKAPLEIVRKKYKKEATDEAVKNLVTDSFRKAITESEIDMLGLPEISDLEFDEEKGMSYKATVNIRPEIRLKNYKGLSLKKAGREIKESDVDSEINSLREMSAKFLTKERNARNGDYIVCNVECAVEGHPAENKENAWLYVGDPAFIPGKELEGLKVNDEKDVEKILPKDYSKKELAGKKAKFHITVKEVKEKILPELNDEFALTAGNFKSVAELRETVRENMKRRNQIEERRELEGQALKILDKAAVFDAPQFMVDRHLEALVDEAKERLKRQQVSEEEIKSMEKDFREKLKDEAGREVRAFFILEEIAKSEKITADDKEIEASLKVIASSSGRSIDEVRKYYDENNRTENLREDIKQRKVLDFIIKNANIS
jgi:trigger factor